MPIVLFHFEGKSYVEIAALLGVTLAKVKTDIHRGREALRAVLRIQPMHPDDLETTSSIGH